MFNVIVWFHVSSIMSGCIFKEDGYNEIDTIS